LALQRRLIFRVLSEIAELARALDLFRQMHAQFGFQIVQLSLEFFFYARRTQILSLPFSAKQNHPLKRRWRLVSADSLSLAFISQRVFDCLAHQRRRRHRVKSLKVFDDFSVARNYKTLRYHAAPVHALDQWLGQRSVVPKNFVIDLLSFEKFFDVIE